MIIINMRKNSVILDLKLQIVDYRMGILEGKYEKDLYFFEWFLNYKKGIYRAKRL